MSFESKVERQFGKCNNIGMYYFRYPLALFDKERSNELLSYAMELYALKVMWESLDDKDGYRRKYGNDLTDALIGQLDIIDMIVKQFKM